MFCDDKGLQRFKALYSIFGLSPENLFTFSDDSYQRKTLPERKLIIGIHERLKDLAKLIRQSLASIKRYTELRH